MEQLNSNSIEDKFINPENGFIYQNMEEISKEDAIKLIEGTMDKFNNSDSIINWVEFTRWNYALLKDTNISKAVGKWWILGKGFHEIIEILAKEDLIEYAKEPVKKMGVTCFYCSEENILPLANRLKDLFEEDKWSKISFKYDEDTVKGGTSKMKLSEI